jgi:hypothetical protein
MRRLLPFTALVAGVLFVGCNDKETPKAQSKGTGTGTETTSSGKKHDTYWCDEHGIPEDDCLMCKVGEEELKKKGDWCDKHDYCKSQCFGCDPKLRERFAVLYRDKYKGKEPPEPDMNPAPKNPKK